MVDIYQLQYDNETYVLRDRNLDVSQTEAYAGLQEVAAAITDFKNNSLTYTALLQFQGDWAEFQDRIMAMVGSPLTAEFVADMTDTNKIYVYVGSETGYTNGSWYYYDGSAWQSGGIYNAIAVNVATIEEIQAYIT